MPGDERVSRYKAGHEARSLAYAFLEARDHWDLKPCCFITAYRADNPAEVNAQKAAELEEDIRGSDLSYIKAVGSRPDGQDPSAPEDRSRVAFCVIDNIYSPFDFEELVEFWRKRYGQEAVYVVMPMMMTAPNDQKYFHGVGRIYDGNGVGDGRANLNPTLKAVDYFLEKRFGDQLRVASVEAHWTSGLNLHSFNGRMIGSGLFKKKYPELVNEKRRNRALRKEHKGFR